MENVLFLILNLLLISASYDLFESQNKILDRDITKIWSKFYLPEKKAICSFIHFLEDEQDKEYVVCIGIKGNYYLVKFDKDKCDTLAEKVCEKYFLKNDC